MLLHYKHLAVTEPQSSKAQRCAAGCGVPCVRASFWSPGADAARYIIPPRRMKMDRPDRFTSNESAFYEASLPRSRPPAAISSRSRTRSGEQPSGVIDLDDLNDWVRRSRSQKPQPRRQSTEHGKEAWPSLVLEEPEPSPAYDDDVPMKNPESRFDQNFLHPPTPNRDSFIKIGRVTNRAVGEDDDTAELRPRRLSVNLERSSRFGWWTLCLLIFAIIMITLTSIYSNGSAKALWRDKFFTTSSSNAIFSLRVMTEACALLLAALVVVVVEDLQWALASRPQGVGLLHFIGLDSGTGVWGLLRLLATADWRQKYSSLFR